MGDELRGDREQVEPEENAHPLALPVALQASIRRLYREGRSYQYIVKALGVSTRTVAKYTKCFPRREFRHRGSKRVDL